MSPALLQELARRWRRRTLVREVLLVGGAAGLGASLILPWARSLAPWVVLAAVLLGVVLFRLRAVRPWAIGPGLVADHLDRTHPELEESCALALRPPASLTVPERLQQQRVNAAWATLGQAAPGRAPAGFWRGTLAGLAVGGIALTLAFAWRMTHPPRSLATVAGMSPVIPAPPRLPARTSPPARPRLSGVEIAIVPPGYTGRPPRTVVGLDAATVEEGARVTWTLHLDGPVPASVAVVFGENVADTLPLRPSATAGACAWEGTRDIGAESGLYRVSVQPPDGPAWTLPEVGSLKVLRDAPPVVTILTPESARTELDPATPPPVGGLPVTVRVTDDYSVRRAWLVATVAKGSGEGVKFRERRVEFEESPPADSPPATGPRDFTCRLDLAALGLGPGDELYFHAEAEDNHPQTPHVARSETRFVVLRGPASVPASAGRGVSGVNLVPEYFRSERQIILDTERLLAERPGLSERDFRRRAEDLGTDQALLRLRYGQFVGEESEAGAGGGGDHTEPNLNPLRPGVPAGVPSDLVHRHDAAGAAEAPANPPPADPRAGLRTAMRLRLEHADQARGGGGHDDAPHPPDAGLPPTATQIVSPYVDQHDSQEKATFFDHDTKATLRGVLAEMWTAESLLRTGRPGDALDPEHRALDGLKELQQGERLYVQRVGFEPAPLRVAERRGRGDVADVPTRATTPGTAGSTEGPALAAVRTALAVLPGGNGTPPGGRPLTAEERAPLAGAGEALTAGAVARPEEGFLEGLRALRRLEAVAPGADSPPVAKDLATVRAALLRLLPPARERPVRPPPVPSRLLPPTGEPLMPPLPPP